MNWTYKTWIFIGLFIINCSRLHSFKLQHSKMLHARNPVDGIGPLQFINKLQKAKRDADGWGLNMEQYDQEPAWMDEGFLNLHDGSNFLDSDLQKSQLNKMRSLSITNNLEVLRNRLMREIGRKKPQDLVVHFGSGRQRKSLGEQLNFLG